MKLMETLGLESWDKLTKEVARSYSDKVAYTTSVLHIIERAVPGRYPLGEWNELLKALNVSPATTPMEAKLIAIHELERIEQMF